MPVHAVLLLTLLEIPTTCFLTTQLNLFYSIFLKTRTTFGRVIVRENFGEVSLKRWKHGENCIW